MATRRISSGIMIYYLRCPECSLFVQAAEDSKQVNRLAVMDHMIYTHGHPFDRAFDWARNVKLMVGIDLGKDVTMAITPPANLTEMTMNELRDQLFEATQGNVQTGIEYDRLEAEKRQVQDRIDQTVGRRSDFRTDISSIELELQRRATL